MATPIDTPSGTRRAVTAPSRRELMSAAGFTALAGIAAAAIAAPDTAPVEALPTDDAELIAIGREAAALVEQRRPLEARWWALPKGCGRLKGSPGHVELTAVSDAMTPLDDRLSELADQAIELRATTPDGWIAKAHLIRHEMEVEYVTDGVVELDMMQPHDRVMWSLLGDLVGGSV